MIPSIKVPRSPATASSGGREQPHHPLAVGHAQRKNPVAERVSCGGHRRVEVGAGVVELGDHHGARHADPTALQPQRSGRLVDALVGRDHEQRAVRRPQAGPQLADEVGVAGGVDQVDLHPAVRQRRQRQPYRTLLLDLGLVAVADRGAVGDRPGPGQNARCHQQGLDERGLAAAGRPDEHDVADGSRIVRGGGGTVARRSVRLVCHDVPSGPINPPFTQTGTGTRAVASNLVTPARTTSGSTSTVTTGPSSAIRSYWRYLLRSTAYPIAICSPRSWTSASPSARTHHSCVQSSS